eukprot:8291-Heterococcus_DN1.PRE.1
MGCTALSRRDTLHRVVALSTACTLAVMLLHSAGVGSAEKQQHIHCIHALFHFFTLCTRGSEVICSTYLPGLTRAEQRHGEEVHANVSLHYQRAPTLKQGLSVSKLSHIGITSIATTAAADLTATSCST